ncbi:MAG: ATPase [Oscillospiraceae bacterium]|jgi:sugar (pentulose or hexulose) kinase|nr:ATPase [Oscillospiraceae bacterium]
MLCLGIELGSTRIKAVLIDDAYKPAASGSHNWENKLEGGFWTYSTEAVWSGIQGAYAELAADYKTKTGGVLTNIDGIGVSAMMHGYLAFDKDDSLLVPFRTWRNTTTAEAAAKLTKAFGFNIPQRWSAAHLYQAILNNEPHVSEIAFMTTLAGYVHWKLTGERVLGIGDASGMFPVDGLGYNHAMLCKFNEITGINITDIFPRILSAGEPAGILTSAGAGILDPTGALAPRIAFCPPEGDAGTGMTATNSIAPRTGNVSAGTSVFAMIVLEESLKTLRTEIDTVTTPTGNPVAMVHCNSCTSDLDAWVKLFGEAAELLGADFDRNTLYEKLYLKALDGSPDGGGLLSYNYFSGEPAAGLDDGCPLFFRKADSKMSLADFMRVQIYSAVATLKLGMDILTEQENVRVDCLSGHGGLFKTRNVGQKLMAAALNIPVSVIEADGNSAAAGEGGAWGIALLAAYAVGNSGEPLEEFLEQRIFAKTKAIHAEPDAKDTAGFNIFFEKYKKGLEIQKFIKGELKL